MSLTREMDIKLSNLYDNSYSKVKGREPLYNYEQRNWVFARNLNFLINISLKPDAVNFWYLKLFLKIIWPNRIHSLKHLRSTTLRYKDKGLENQISWRKTQLISNSKVLSSGICGWFVFSWWSEEGSRGLVQCISDHQLYV